MKKIVLSVIVAASLALMASDAFSAQIIKQGTSKVAVSAAADFTQIERDVKADVYVLALAGEYGYFVTDNIELAVRTMLAWTQLRAHGVAGRTTATMAILDFVPKWHFATDGKIVPYIGPQLAYIYATFKTSGLSSGTTNTVGYGGVLGADVFLSDQTSLFVEYNLFIFYARMKSLHVNVMNNMLDAGLAYWW